MEAKVEDKIISSVFWRFFEKILAQGIAFIVSVVLARLLLPSDYGMVSVVNVFMIIADVFISSGFSTALIQKRDAYDTNFTSIFYCSLAVSIFIYYSIYNSTIYCKIL